MPRLKKRVALLLPIVLLVWLLLDLGLWFTGGITFASRLQRLAAGAPVVHVAGRELKYTTIITRNAEYFEPYTTSDEGYPLLKARSTGPFAPWIFLHKAGDDYFRYKRPKPGL